jgi:acetoacetate decarboxylase
MPGLTRYGYREVIGGFFEFPTENARRILPAHIEPAELHHGTSIFSMNVFDFTESMVGPYKEAVMAVIVAPLVKPGERLPKSAFYPYLVATTTKAAREHAIERWHLPHWMSDVEIGLEPGPGRLTARVRADGAPVADLTITEHSWSPVSHLYQSFMRDGDQTYLAHITMEGKQSEHEDEKGALTLHDHPFNQPLVISEVYETPFRELWMRSGMQTFEPLVELETA